MRRRPLAVGAAAVATIWSVVLPAIAVDTLDINPGWQQTSGYASWIASAHNTSASDDFKFTYGDTGSVTWMNVGASSYWFQLTSRTFPYPCGGSVNYTQKLQHLNSSASDTATTKVNGGSPCSP